ncbi:MAG: hypothetical protein ACTSYA_05590 [Candidatus Kariarchaeaceae archaeon]
MSDPSETTKPEIKETTPSTTSDAPEVAIPEITSHPDKCPLHNDPLQRGLNLLMVGFGALGLIYLNLWLSISYFIIFIIYYSIIIPVKGCQYCFFHIKGLTLDQWKKEYGSLNEANWKKYEIGLSVMWIVPMIGISISLFIEFELVSFVCLVLFTLLLVALQINLKKNICPNCEVMPMCPMYNKE